MDPKSKEPKTTNFQSVPGMNVLINQFLNIPKSMASFKSLIEKEEFLLYSLPLFYLLPGIKNENNEVTISEYCTEQFKDAYLIQQSKLSSLKLEFRDFAIISFLQNKIVSSWLGNAKINTLTPQELKSLESQIKEINDFLSGNQQLDPQKLIQKGGVNTLEFFTWLCIANILFLATGMNTGLNNTTRAANTTDLIETVPINMENVNNTDAFLAGNITEALKEFPEQGNEKSLQTLKREDPQASNLFNKLATNVTKVVGVAAVGAAAAAAEEEKKRQAAETEKAKQNKFEDNIATEMAKKAAEAEKTAQAEEARIKAEEEKTKSYTKQEADQDLANSLLSGRKIEGWEHSNQFTNHLKLENNLNKSTFTFDLSEVKAEMMVYRFHQITEDPSVKEEDKDFYQELGTNLDSSELNIVIKTLLRYPKIQTLDEMIGKNITTNEEGKMVDTEIQKDMLSNSQRFFVGERSISEAASSLTSQGPSKEENFFKLKKILNSLDSKTTNELTQKFTKVQELMTSIEEAFTNISTKNVDNLMTMFFQIGDDISLIEGNESRFIDNWVQEIQKLMYSKFENNPTLKELFDNFLQENEQIKGQIKQLELATADQMVSQVGDIQQAETELSQKGLQMILSPTDLREDGPYDPYAVVIQPNNKELTPSQRNKAVLLRAANAPMLALSQRQFAQAAEGEITQALEKQVSPKVIKEIQDQNDLANNLQEKLNEKTAELDELRKKKEELEAKIADSPDLIPSTMQSMVTGVSPDVKEYYKTTEKIAETQSQLQMVAADLSELQNVMLPQMLLKQVKRNYAQTNDYIQGYKKTLWSKFKEMYEAVRIGMEKPDIVNFEVSAPVKKVEGSLKSVPTLTIKWAHPDFKLKKEALELKKISLNAFKKILQYGKDNFAEIESSGKQKTWFEYLQLTDSNEATAKKEIDEKIKVINLSLEKIGLAMVELTRLEDTIGSVTVVTFAPEGFNSSIPIYSPVDLDLVFDENSFMMLGKGMFVFNNTLTAIAGMTNVNQLNDEFMRKVREEAGGTWLSWYRSYNFDIMASLGKLPLMALGLGGWFSYYFDIIKWPGAILIAIFGLAVGKTYFDPAKDLGYGIFNATKTATGWVMNTSWTLILTTAQLNGNNLTQTEIAVRFGKRLVVTGGIVYLVEYIGIGDSIMYLQYLSYVYNGAAMLSGVPSMLGMSKKLIGSRNLSELKLLKGVSEYFSKFLTSNNVIDNFDSLSEERKRGLMTDFYNSTDYKDLVTKLPDAQAQSIIESSVDNVDNFDNVNVFVDQVDAGKWIIRINWLIKGAIVYQFVSLIDNILEIRGTWRQISSYFATPESDQRNGIEGSVQKFTPDELTGKGTGTVLPPLVKTEIEEEENREDAAAAQEAAAQEAAAQEATQAATTPARISGQEAAAATQAATQGCPTTLQIRRLLNQQKQITGRVEKTTYNQILNAALGADTRAQGCDYPKIENDYKALKQKLDEEIDNEINVSRQTIENIAKQIDNMLVKLYQGEDTNGPLHQLGPQLVGGKKKKGSKKNKVEKKKGRKTKRKMYTIKKKGNSKKHKKISKVKRNTRRK